MGSVNIDGVLIRQFLDTVKVVSTAGRFLGVNTHTRLDT
jgi:hypothetical protein